MGLRRLKTAAGVAALVLVGCAVGGPARAQTHLVAGYADAARSSGCAEAAPGTFVTHHGFAWVPEDQGMAYVTFRLEVPPNLAPRGAPRTGAAVSDLIVTPFADGSWEWNLLVTGCPPGWVAAFAQDYEVLDAQPAELGIRAAGSMLRDCTFVLNDVAVVSRLAVNLPGCGDVSAGPVTWGCLKARYR